MSLLIVGFWCFCFGCLMGFLWTEKSNYRQRLRDEAKYASALNLMDAYAQGRMVSLDLSQHINAN